jgi:hypothetical protein
MQVENELNEPWQETLVGRLAAVKPTLGAREREALLYECGYAAGRKSAQRGWAWPALLAASVLVLAFSSHGLWNVEPAPKEHQIEVVQRAGDAERPDEKRTAPQAKEPVELLLAHSRWRQIRRELDTPAADEVFSFTGSWPEQPALRAGVAWLDAERR